MNDHFVAAAWEEERRKASNHIPYLRDFFAMRVAYKGTWRRFICRFFGHEWGKGIAEHHSSCWRCDRYVIHPRSLRGTYTVPQRSSLRGGDK